MTPAEQAWDQVVRDFRQVCLLKREGKPAESDRVLGEVLPVSIAAWSQLDPLDSLAKRMRLQAMFDAEQRRLEEVWALQEKVFAQLSTTVVSELKQQLSDSLRQEFHQWLSERSPQGSPQPAPPSQAVTEGVPWRPEPQSVRPVRPRGLPAPAFPSAPPPVWRF